jgi:hypothetical protein
MEIFVFLEADEKQQEVKPGRIAAGGPLMDHFWFGDCVGGLKLLRGSQLAASEEMGM